MHSDPAPIDTFVSTASRQVDNQVKTDVDITSDIRIS